MMDHLQSGLTVMRWGSDNVGLECVLWNEIGIRSYVYERDALEIYLN